MRRYVTIVGALLAFAMGTSTEAVLAQTHVGDGNHPSTTSATNPPTTSVATPVISPGPGTYSTGQTVTISESTPGATIYYLVVGAISTNGYIPYTGPIQLTEGGSEYIDAYATEAGYIQSNDAQETLTLNLPAAPVPVISPAPGSYGIAQTVTISDALAGATIYYTTNGSPPSFISSIYTGPLSVASSETVVATAIAPGYSFSAPSSAQYLIGGTSSALIYTVAGTGTVGRSGDGGPATLADLAYPGQTALDSAGNLYIADTYNQQVRKVAAGTRIITTMAGNGSAGYSGDQGPAIRARRSAPS